MTHEDQGKKLTSVQEKFCQEVIKDWVGNKAYSRASGSTNLKSCGVQASKLMKMPKVQERIKVLTTDILGPLEKELIGNVQFWVSVRDDPDGRLADRMKASEYLAKWRSMFVEKSEVSMEAAVTIIDDIK